ncbi:MAG: hypothetical protein HQK65_22015, partial [Desulfamplus sp.]|nr:hypothetical protein [Desulfamplus sp.]
MKKTILSILFILLLTSTGNVYASSSYMSSYSNIQWGNRGEDTFYCIDICDENWNIYLGFQALKCGEDLYSWSPKDYINNILGVPDSALLGFKFNWRIWSNSGYGGEGFEGQVIVGEESSCKGSEYLSTEQSIQWSCRGNDTFYCIDIFDSKWNMLHQAATCG